MKFILFRAAALAVAVFAAPIAQAATLSNLSQAFNTFQANAFPGLTDSLQVSVDQSGGAAIGAGVEIPGFGLGTYDVDVAPDALTMTLAADPNNLGLAVYDSATFDRYFYSFDIAVASASVDASTNPSFAASVEVIAPGTVFDFDGVLGFPGVDPTLPTSFAMPNGGILITIGDGTNLFDVRTGGSLRVNIAAVPVPAALPLVLAGLAGFGIFARRQRRAAA
ncbi:MAG: VPLPA-CTERM sorting domain-containing protein [Pseudomonadota bacterium]